MRHPRWSAGLIIALLFATCAATTVLAQPVARDWNTLRARPAPTWPVRVTRFDGSHQEGYLRAVDSLALVLGYGSETRRIPAVDVRRLERADARIHRIWRHGVPVGFVTGGLLLMAVDAFSGNPEPGEAFAMGAVLFGIPIGAGTAAVLPVRPLYLAPP